MPELPEVETTIKGLKKTIVGLVIKDVWTDLATQDKRKRNTVADVKFFKIFKKEILGRKIISIERRAKNILINLAPTPSAFSHSPSGRGRRKTILIHMKMTGHLLYGKYKFHPSPTLPLLRGGRRVGSWIPVEPKSPLNDPYNRFIHVIFTLSNGRHLAFSDARKFGKITLLDPEGKSTSYGASTKSSYLAHLGPEPLEKNFTLEKLKGCLNKKQNGKIKTVLMDQSVVAGIGNIYSDEILWRAGVHPERKVSTLLRPSIAKAKAGKQGFSGQEIQEKELKLIFRAIKETLKKGIHFGGDSMSDYRNIYGLPGKFQLHHEAYKRAGQKCRKLNCKGIIKRKKINNRSAHFCFTHQK